MTDTPEFTAFADAKRRIAETADLRPVRTLVDRKIPSLVPIGNNWTRWLYDGDFTIRRWPDGLPQISLVFVQSHDRNTVAADPSAFGAGPIDEHLIYEGLARVAADGVLAGARSVGRNAFFSVWHPELISLRRALRLPRHPAQIVVSKEGHVDFEALLFNVPQADVFLIAGDECRRKCEASLRARPWITIVPFEHGGFRTPLEQLRSRGVARLSVIGGRRTASSLVDEGLVEDLYLTTTSRTGGEPGSSWYAGSKALTLDVLTRKQWSHENLPVTFEHIALKPHP